jgi:hypothetical protein
LRIARTASSTFFFVSSVGASPVSRTRRLKLVALTCAAGNSLRSRAKTRHSMFSSSRYMPLERRSVAMSAAAPTPVTASGKQPCRVPAATASATAVIRLRFIVSLRK